MFSFLKKKASPLKFKQVRLFGKLPGFADFVRFRSADPEAVIWDKWVTDGVSSLMLEGNAATLEHYWSLNICREINGVYHLASLLSSHDKSGRYYPLVLLAQVQNDWLKDYKPSFPILFEILSNFGRDIQLYKLNNQAALITEIGKFEKTSWPLSKTEVLDARIDALKQLNLDQTWGRCLNEFPSIQPHAWKINQIQSIRQGKSWEFPLGSEHDATESSYWLQMVDDIRGLKNSPLQYFSLYSEPVKKMAIDLSEKSMPDFKTLFKPYQPPVLNHTPDPKWTYCGEMDLLEGANYWKQAVR